MFKLAPFIASPPIGEGAAPTWSDRTFPPEHKLFQNSCFYVAYLPEQTDE